MSSVFLSGRVEKSQNNSKKIKKDGKCMDYLKKKKHTEFVADVKPFCETHVREKPYQRK